MSNNEWDTVGGGFCENLLYGFPEYANSISSWFISFIGLWGLVLSLHNSHVMRWIYSLYAWAGVGSFLFHWYGYRFYGHLDVVPLLISSWLVVYEGWRIVFEKMCIHNYYNGVLDKIYDFMAFSCSFALVLTLCVRVVRGEPWGINLSFTQLFAIPQLIALACLPAMYLQWKGDDYVVTKSAFRYLLTGFLLALCSAIIWLSTEPFCKERDENGELKYPIIQYMFTHTLWHIGIIWGAHIILQSAIYFDMRTDGNRPIYVSGGNSRVMRFIFFIFPIVKIEF